MGRKVINSSGKNSPFYILSRSLRNWLYMLDATKKYAVCIWLSESGIVI